MSTEHRKVKLQNEHIRDQLATHEKQFIKLEHEYTTERKILLDELTRKNEQLNIYVQTEMLAELEINAGGDPGKQLLLSDPNRRTQRCLDLAQKIGEMQKTEESLRMELKGTKKENENLQVVKKSYEQMLNYSNQPAGSILAALKEKTDEIQNLKREQHEYRAEMHKLKSDKAKFNNELSAFVVKRQKLEEMIKAFRDLQTFSKHSKEKGCNPNTYQNEAHQANKVPSGEKPSCAPDLRNLREHDILSLRSSNTHGRNADMSIHLVHHNHLPRK
mmetsp:Transcript_14905/g.21265  ORF Transcript_14905/g.21265 Transcript_14905/m.21265 type:complete len:274 (+) Transcript_14905:113-934(+)